MKKHLFLFTFIIFICVFTACGQETDPPAPNGQGNLQLTVDERKDIFASYFNHSLAYKTGQYMGEDTPHSHRIECADGSEFTYSICKSENLGFYHPMTGSLDNSLPLEKGEEIIVFYIRGEDGVNYAKTVSATDVSVKYLRSPSQQDHTPQDYYRQMQSVIRANLDKISAPQVLTLDEALAVFWQESGLSQKDFLQKTSTHGDVFYQHKTDGRTIMATVSLCCTQAQDTETLANADDAGAYAFVVLQSTGENYVINVDGTVTTTEKLPGVYK